MRFTVRVKLYLGYTAVFVLIFLLSVTVYLNVSTIMKNVGWVEHTYNILNEIEVIKKAIVDMETGERGFLLAGEDKFLELYENGQKTVKEAIEKGQSLTSDNPAQVKWFKKVESLIQEWYDKAGGPEIEACRRMNAGEITFDDVTFLIKKKPVKI